MTEDKPQERIRCRLCGMTFVVADPPSKRAEIGTCGEPNCRRVHWASQRKRTEPVTCGVWPERIEA